MPRGKPNWALCLFNDYTQTKSSAYMTSLVNDALCIKQMAVFQLAVGMSLFVADLLLMKRATAITLTFSGYQLTSA